jgi:hypothetical protein
MILSDETLMAYVDGELDAEARTAVDAAVAADPEVAQRLAQHKALRLSLQRTYDEVLSEPVPQRLVNAARSAPAGAHEAEVADLASARAARAKSHRRTLPSRVSWSQWGTIAASLLVGLIIGQFFLNTGDVGPFVTRGGELLARGALAQALSAQLASNQSQSSTVQIGVSFRARGGTYCRTFALSDAQSRERTLAGLACHERGTWQIEVLAPGEKRAPGAYRMAGSQAPKAVLQGLEDRIEGEPLDASGEAEARQHGWQP